MKRLYWLTPTASGLIVAVLCLLAACTSSPETKSTPYGLRAELQGTPPERTWAEPAFQKTATLSSGEDYTLFNPAVVWILDDGRAYVWDAGDYKLKAFTRDGDYVTAYVKGRGEGPGQVQSYRSVGLRRDSVYVLDSRNRRLSFFGSNGTFGRSRQYQGPLDHLVWGGESIRYELYAGPGTPPSLDITTGSGQETTLSNLLARDVSSIAFDGILHATEQHAVYAPYYYPLLLTVAPGDTTADAYPTPDYGDAPLPEPRREGSPGREVIRPPSTRVNWKSTLDGGVLSVQQRASEEVVAFDLYNVREMEYIHSVRLPVGNASARYAYGAGLLAVERDTTVDLYDVERSTR